MRIDGSYAGMELGRGGVGAHAAANSGDAFEVYRQQRSGRYHSVMASKSTNPNRCASGGVERGVRIALQAAQLLRAAEGWLVHVQCLFACLCAVHASHKRCPMCLPNRLNVQAAACTHLAMILRMLRNDRCLRRPAMGH